MIICDEYLALAALSENLPFSTTARSVATTPAAWSRVLRSRHRAHSTHHITAGRLNALINQLSPDCQAKLTTPSPQLLNILDPRPFLDTSARLTIKYRLSYMAAEMAAAAIFHNVALYFARERNVPPGIRDLLEHENLPGIHITFMH